ncbi:hypothetical protein NNJEOMEG_01603 [Fundidesulfovibrio magnetotacticus]|uniref:MOSC domain-containing protein n=1 Tax=Fundidesulfovibrio magnetotacticus TaxID=2730080 RepID=A0A6V8LUH9_9BACT|nr:MOSC domain-containing protein [Fundidesulfovibrio magnetotacticus]GFK93769.1 hypothetical protein NNJEOMEG_01603 [Fundidesulfovibrio magnetotacticus]
MAVVRAVSVSDRKGAKKAPVESVELVAEHGVAGDAHAGSHRQVSLLDFGAMEGMRLQLPTIGPGSFAENLAVEGLDALGLALGDRIGVGPDAVLEITQIGKECHQGCEIRRIVGDCIMPRQGLFARVLQGGAVRPGDGVRRVKS